jgi:hypothetical protein
MSAPCSSHHHGDAVDKLIALFLTWKPGKKGLWRHVDIGGRLHILKLAFCCANDNAGLELISKRQLCQMLTEIDLDLESNLSIKKASISFSRARR